jgi:hypothetical protein
MSFKGSVCSCHSITIAIRNLDLGFGEGGPDDGPVPQTLIEGSGPGSFTRARDTGLGGGFIIQNNRKPYTHFLITYIYGLEFTESIQYLSNTMLGNHDFRGFGVNP